jgi:MoaA/NifB/PqqE/SkfB family radical SAM enzyme
MKRLKKIAQFVNYGFPGRRPPTPLLVIFHITTRCDMACLHCGDDVWGDPKDDLTLEEIERFSKDLGKVESVALGGGEPFLRKDLPEICALFVNNNKVATISIPSNGFSTDNICSSVLSILKAYPGLNLNIMLSLDGFQETHDLIRTQGSFAKVMKTAQQLKALISAFPNLAVSFNATINNNNWQELPSLAQFLRDKFSAKLQFNIISGNPRDPAFAVPARTNLEQTLDGLLNNSSPSFPRRLYNALYRDILLQTNFESRQTIPCRAGSLVCLIDANGDVRSCPMLTPLGNLRARSFSSIWHDQRAELQFQSIINGACLCNNDCFIRLSLSHYWRLPFLMLRRLSNFRVHKHTRIL